MKIFQTSSVDVVKDCQTMFNFRRVSELVLDRKRKFFAKIVFERQYYMWSSCIYGEGRVIKPTFS